MELLRNWFASMKVDVGDSISDITTDKMVATCCAYSPVAGPTYKSSHIFSGFHQPSGTSIILKALLWTLSQLNLSFG